MAASKNLTQVERTLRARAAALRSWASTNDRAARTAPAREAADQRFVDEVDPDRVLAAEERDVRVASARRAHMMSMSRRSSRARRGWVGDSRAAKGCDEP